MKVNDIINNKYEIASIISDTSKATVGKCINRYLNNEWIIKFVPSKSSIISSEVENMLKFNHRSIPKIIDLVNDAEGYYFIMTEIKGHTICDYVKVFKYTLSDVIVWMTELIEVLKHIHCYNVIHGDIKSSNIMIDDYNSLYVIDFGSSFSELDKKSFTKKYVAPERLLDHFKADDRSDIFSFGIVFKEILIHYNENGKLRRFIESRRLNKLNKVIKKCTEINPSNRYQSASEVYDVMREI